MVSYEVSIGIIIINVLLCVGSLNLKDIVLAQQKVWFIVPLFPMFVIFFISVLAETNRPPFDLPEAESELVAGYQTEYSGMMYAMFWLGEYANYFINVRPRFNFISRWLAISDRTISFYTITISILDDRKNFIIIFLICINKGNCSKVQI